MDADTEIFTEVPLPCGKVLSSRLVKVAMYEHLASLFGGPPNENHYTLYSHWAKHQWGMVITGNVQVSENHLTLGRDMVVPKILSEATLSPFRKLAAFIHGEYHDGTGRCQQSLAIMQLNHSGRQSCNILGGRYPFVRPLGPSAARFGTSKKNGLISEIFHRLLFQTPRAMSSVDIENAVSEFVRGAVLAVQSGFDGVQLHAAHGYLLAQFLSPKANQRIDAYSNESLLFLKEIVQSIREAVPAVFVLGIKFNVRDYNISDQSDECHAQEERALSHLREVVSWGGIDFIELSGGDYENPEFMSTSSTSISSRQAFFAGFSHRAMEMLSSCTPSDSLPLILLTGGLRTPAHLNTALVAKHAHLLGIGRGAVLSPDLPTLLKQQHFPSEDGDVVVGSTTPFKPEPDLTLPLVTRWPWRSLWAHVPKIPLIGAGVGMAWYLIMMRRLASGPSSYTQKSDSEEGVSGCDYDVGGLGAVVRMWLWVDAPELRRKGTSMFSAAACVAVLAILYTLFSVLLL